MESPPPPRRYPLIDALRGLAVALMVAYHLAYDLAVLELAPVDPGRTGPFWGGFPNLIIALFLFSAGVSLRLCHVPVFSPGRFWRRWAKIALAALAVSLCTYALFPEGWIYFGVLHCIALGSLAALPLLGSPRLALAFALALLALEAAPVALPRFELAHESLDYVPPFPWFAWIFLGLFAHSLGVHRLGMHGRWPVALTLPGRHCLAIYLLHQPLLYGGLWLLARQLR